MSSNSSSSGTTPVNNEIHRVSHLEQYYGPVSVLLTVFSNTLLLGYEMTRHQRRLSTNLPRMLILLLSVSDLLAMCLGYLPALLVSLLDRRVKLGVLHVICAFFLKGFWTLSQCLVVVMAVERYTSINKPYFYQKHVDGKVLIVVVCVTSVYSIGVAVFPLLGVVSLKSQQIPYVLVFSTFALPAYDYLLLTQNAVLLSCLLFCNISVMRTLRAMEASVVVSCPRDRAEYLRRTDLLNGPSREFSRLMAVISLIFLICSLPKMVRCVCRRSFLLPSPLADYLSWNVTLLTGVLNPFLYGLLRRKIRAATRARCKTLCLCCTYNRVQPRSGSVPSVRTVRLNGDVT